MVRTPCSVIVSFGGIGSRAIGRPDTWYSVDSEDSSVRLRLAHQASFGPY